MPLDRLDLPAPITRGRRRRRRCFSARVGRRGRACVWRIDRVSLTILAPVTTQPVRVLGLDVDRNGVATLEATTPSVGPVSQIVMASISRESSLGVSASLPSAQVPAKGASARLSYLVGRGPSRADVQREPVQLLLRYLTVAGT